MILTNEDVEEIIRILDATPHDELRLTTRAFDLHLRRAGGGWTQEMRTLIRPNTLDPQSPIAEAPKLQGEDDDVEGLASIRAPMVGTFYRAPKPGAPPFVEIGAAIGEHGIVGIIETMKLMNAISAGFEGEIVDILVSDGQLVEAGQALMRLRPRA
jgi:acetyl-CoA carboxylase biotin carboxyl carrier protein